MTTVVEVRQAFGDEALVSDWVDVTQELMNDFARATDDWDWMHTDPDRARAEGFDGTIAFGFWTLSMLTRFLRGSMGREYPPDVLHGFNYGVERARFIRPIPVGSRIRNRMVVSDVRPKGPGRFLVTTHNEVEIEGEEGPAMVADWLTLFVYPD